MISKTLIILATTGFVTLGTLSAHAADGRDQTLYPDRAPATSVFEGRNVAVPALSWIVTNENAAIRDRVELDSRSPH